MTHAHRPTTSRGDVAPVSRPRPVMVGGCPRSGTTLLGAMLGVGPDVLTVPEAGFKWELMARTERAGGRLSGDDVRRILGRHRDGRLWGVEERSLDGVEPLDVAEVMVTLARAHGEAVDKPEPVVWVDHTPWNLKYAASLARALPEARFVHVVRDGRAVLASVRQLDWGPNTADDAAWWWAAHVAVGLAAEAALGPSRVLRVRYEDLIRHPEAVLGDVTTFADIPYDDAMVVDRDYRVHAYSAKQHRLVAHPPDRDRVDRWARELSDRQVETFERRTGDLLELLGYSPRYGVAARQPARGAASWERTLSRLRRRLIDPVRRARRRRSAVS